MGHRFVSWICRLLLRLFHRRVTVLDAGRVPATGPLVVCANHHGSLIDPMALLAFFPRRLRPLAKAPLFRDPVVSPFLRAVGALPVYRAQDRHLVQGSNEALLAACRDALVAGECILIFPEGLSKPEPVLSPLKPGAARMALDADAAAGQGLGVKLVPVAIHLDQATRFRRGKVVIQVGEPIVAAVPGTAVDGDGDRSVAGLTERLDGALRSLLVDVESQEDLRLLRVAVRAWAQARGTRLTDAEETATARDFARGWRELQERDPRAAVRLRTAVESYARALEHFGLRGGEIDISYRPARVVTYALGQVLILALGAPAGLLGAALNWPPFRITGLVAGRLSESEDVWASLKVAVALVLFPLYWILLAAAAALAASPAIGLAVLLAAPATGLWALRFLDLRSRFGREVRAFFLLAGGGGLRRHLAASRQTIHNEVERLRAEDHDAPVAEPRR